MSWIGKTSVLWGRKLVRTLIENQLDGLMDI